MTTKEILDHDWKTLRGKLRERWHALTEQDLESINGNYDVLVSVLQEKYSFNEQAAKEEVSRFFNEFAMPAQPVRGS